MREHTESSWNENNRLLNMMRHPNALRVAVLTAIVCKVVLAYIFTDLEGDKSLYLLMADNFLQGGSIMEPITLPDGRTGQTNPILLVSPVYILLAIPALFVSNSFDTASLLIEALGWTIFFTGLASVALKMLRDKAVVVLLVIAMGFIIYPHQLYSVPKDTIAAGLLLFILSKGYDLVVQNQYSGKKVFSLSALLILLGLTKYLFLPLSILFLVILIIISISRSLRGPLIGFGVALIVLLFFLAYSRFYYQPDIPAEFVTVNTQERFTTKGFEPAVVGRTYPFISAAFINVNAFAVQIANITGLGYNTVMNIFRVLDIIIICLAALLLFPGRKRTKHSSFFLYTFLVTFILSYAILLYLSMTRTVTNIHQAEQFAFVAEARTYFVFMIFIQLSAAALFLPGSPLPSWAKYALGLFFFLQIAHGIAFTAKQVLKAQEKRNELRLNTPLKKLVVKVQSIQRTDTAAKFATAIPTLRRYAAISGLKPVAVTSMDCSEIRNSTTVFWVAVYANDTSFKKCFEPGSREHHNVGPYVLYQAGR